jgi:hypothetical protein
MMQSLVSSNGMARSVKIVLSLIAVVLLIRPFDCFASVRTPEAMQCCLKGKCAPTAKADDCCKNTVPSVNHFVGSKAAGHMAPVFAIAASFMPAAPPALFGQARLDLVRHPPPSGNLNTLNLPLLI